MRRKKWWVEGNPAMLSRPNLQSSVALEALNSRKEHAGYVPILGDLCMAGRLDEALQTVHLMERRGLGVSRDIICCLLQGCIKTKDLAAGRQVHSLMVRNGLDSITFLGDHLIRMFASCGSLAEASNVFSKASKPSVYTWNAIISAHATLGDGQKSLELCHKMQQNGVSPDTVTFSCILKACGNVGSLLQGRLAHDQIIRSELESDVVVGNSLVNMYANCGSVVEAHRVFDGLQKPDVVSWGAMITGYAQNGHDLQAFESFEKMQQQGNKPNRVIFLCTLKACSNRGAIERGRLIQDQIVRCGSDSDVMLGNSLIDMYAKCGGLEDSCRVFEKLPSRDVVSWDAMIAGFVYHGHGILAFEHFEKMQQEGLKPDKFTYSGILKACSNEGAIQQGRAVHDWVTRCGLGLNAIIGNTLLDMYAKCGFLVDGYKVFDRLPNRDVVSWGTMITGFVQHGFGLCALEYFEKMLQEGISPNNVVLLSIVQACTSVGVLGQGRLVHDLIMTNGVEIDEMIGSTLVHMYAKCGSLEEACKAFDMMPNLNAITCDIMIAGYVHHGHSLHAVELFENMHEGIKSNEFKFLCMLKACAKVGALIQGRLIHEEIIKNKIESHVVVGSALIDMYAKCGSLKDAHRVLDQLPKGNAVSWGAMIAGYANYGHCKLAVECLKDMKSQGVKLDHVIFTNILNACSNAGLLDEGCQYFTSMRQEYGIVPGIDHYNCMIDLFGRAGCLIEAEDLLHSIPFPPDIIGWMSLLSCCRTYSNSELGRRCFNQVVQLDPTDASGYVLMSNVYANAHKWDDSKNVQESGRCVGLAKKPGIAWIEFSNQVHEFIVGGKRHLQSVEIYDKLERVNSLIKGNGFVHQLDLVMELKTDEVFRDDF